MCCAEEVNNEVGDEHATNGLPRNVAYLRG